MADQSYATGPDPLYVQLAERIRSKIKNNTYSVGTQLPSEEALREHVDMSRSTVRKALAILESEGLITKVRGKGSFVAQPSHRSKSQSLFTSMTDHINTFGKTLTTRLVDIRKVSANHEQASFFDISDGTPLLELERVRYIDGDPFCVERTWFTEKYKSLATMDLSGSLYRLLEDKFGTYPSTGKKLFSIVQALPNDQFMLNVPAKTPLMLVEDLVYDSNGHPLHITKQRIRSDQYKYAVKSPS